MARPLFIAEVKTQSPYGFESDKNWDELFEIANEHGDWLSIHTDYRWGGSFDLIRRARSLTDKPILAKGVHDLDDEVSEAVDSGADSVLVVNRLPGVHIERCLIEPIDLYGLIDLPETTRAVWNQRNLSNGAEKLQTFQQARGVWGGWLVQASYIARPEAVVEGADAFIVGEKLPEFVAAIEQV